MPSFATAHTFCAFRDGPSNKGFLRTGQLTQCYFCAAYDYRKILATVIGIPKKKKKIRDGYAYAFKGDSIAISDLNQTYSTLLKNNRGIRP